MTEGSITVEDAVKWVDQNKGLIVTLAGKYIPFTPYDRDDFVQDAYESAIVAACVARKKNLTFEACFWTMFNRNIGRVVPHSFLTKHSGSVSPASTLCDDVESFIEVLPTQEDKRPRHDVDHLYLAICEFLSDSERKIWLRALGITPKGRMSNYEIAEDLGCSAANVRQTIRRVIARLSKKVRAKVLHVPSVTVETLHISFDSGRSIKSTRPKKPAMDEEVAPNRLAEVS